MVEFREGVTFEQFHEYLAEKLKLVLVSQDKREFYGDLEEGLIALASTRLRGTNAFVENVELCDKSMLTQYRACIEAISTYCLIKNFFPNIDYSSLEKVIGRLETQVTIIENHFLDKGRDLALPPL